MGALGDSFYEYLLKSWLVTSKDDTEARDMYYEAMEVRSHSVEIHIQMVHASMCMCVNACVHVHACMYFYGVGVRVHAWLPLGLRA